MQNIRVESQSTDDSISGIKQKQASAKNRNKVKTFIKQFKPALNVQNSRILAFFFLFKVYVIFDVKVPLGILSKFRFEGRFIFTRGRVILSIRLNMAYYKEKLT